MGGKEDTKIGSTFNKSTETTSILFYSDVETSENKKAIKDSIIEFFNIIDTYINKINIEGVFSIDRKAYELFKNTRSIHIEDYLVQGIKSFQYTKENKIEETLFFYPLIGILNKLANDLVNS